MDEYTILEKLGQVAGIGGIALGVFLLIFRDVIRKNIFPNLTRQQAYNIIRLVLAMTFLIAVLGIGAWVWSEAMHNNKNGNDTPPDTEQGNYRRIYYQGFDITPDDSELNSMWIKGETGDWQGSFSDGVHTLCNISRSPSASFTSTFRYIAPEGKEVDLSNAKVTMRVNVLPPSSKYSSAGILFRKGAARPDYYAYVLNSGNSVSLMYRSGSSMNIIWTREITLLASGDLVKLSLIGKNNSMQMYVNDQLIAEQDELELVQGNPGIFAYSTGCFVFDGFSLFQPIN